MNFIKGDFSKKMVSKSIGTQILLDKDVSQTETIEENLNLINPKAQENEKSKKISIGKTIGDSWINLFVNIWKFIHPHNVVNTELHQKRVFCMDALRGLSSFGVTIGHGVGYAADTGKLMQYYTIGQLLPGLIILGPLIILMGFRGIYAMLTGSVISYLTLKGQFDILGKTDFHKKFWIGYIFSILKGFGSYLGLIFFSSVEHMYSAWADAWSTGSSLAGIKFYDPSIAGNSSTPMNFMAVATFICTVIVPLVNYIILSCFHNKILKESKLYNENLKIIAKQKRICIYIFFIIFISLSMGFPFSINCVAAIQEYKEKLRPNINTFGKFIMYDTVSAIFSPSFFSFFPFGSHSFFGCALSSIFIIMKITGESHGVIDEISKRKIIRDKKIRKNLIIFLWCSCIPPLIFYIITEAILVSMGIEYTTWYWIKQMAFDFISPFVPTHYDITPPETYLLIFLEALLYIACFFAFENKTFEQQKKAAEKTTFFKRWSTYSLTMYAFDRVICYYSRYLLIYYDDPNSDPDILPPFSCHMHFQSCYTYRTILLGLLLNFIFGYLVTLGLDAANGLSADWALSWFSSLCGLRPKKAGTRFSDLHLNFNIDPLLEKWDDNQSKASCCCKNGSTKDP